MYSYDWDIETGGYLLNSSPSIFSKEPRPVYYEELDILGFHKYWNYAKNADYPYMWAEANNYYYHGSLVAKTKGGSLYTAPELILLENPEPNGNSLRFVDIHAMIDKNEAIMESLVQNTIKKIYNTYVEYKNRIDVFYVAFSGGKDSVTALDLVQRALPHNSFKVIFGNTGMEFPDTYDIVSKIEQFCLEHEIQFKRAKSKLNPSQTWSCFGPPATTNRWCCSVHKTSPQIKLLRDVTGIDNFTGMAFTGVRADESATRSEYDDISFGEKHQGQYSCHPILEWNSAELFLYIYKNNLLLNNAYRKGNSRVGCMVCPMSSGKHEYMKHVSYLQQVETFIEQIKSSSGKTQFSDSEMHDFIDAGHWKNRRSGRELNFGQDKFVVISTATGTEITVFKKDINWLVWAKTIGRVIKVSEDFYTIDFCENVYQVSIKHDTNNVTFSFPNCRTSKFDIKFLSLFRSVIIKSIYCINCGVCAVECKNHSINMTNGLIISEDCIHCYKCHEIYEHCLRYNSIRNKIGAEKKMKGLDRYFSFGVRQNWLTTFIKYKGGEEFWNTDGDGEVANKKKDTFLNFAKDAELVQYDKRANGDKYTKYKPLPLVDIIGKLGANNKVSWGLLLTNLVYTAEFNWFIRNIKKNDTYTTDHIKLLLADVMENDSKGLGKRNIVDAFKVLLIKTPLGKELGLGNCNYIEKVNSAGNEIITLNSITRTSWQNPEPLVILYALYKFAEACGDYYQFTLSRLLNHDINSDGISPTETFGLDRETMEHILNGLTVKYPDYISASFTLNLDNITLRSVKTSADVLALF